MTETWSPDDLHAVEVASELQIAVERSDATLHRWTPIWVVAVGGEV